MKRALLRALIVCLALAACGRQATPDPAVVARAVEGTLTARAQLPTLNLQARASPVPSSPVVPSVTHTPVPAPALLGQPTTLPSMRSYLLGGVMTIEYPSDWQMDDDGNIATFSPQSLPIAMWNPWPRQPQLTVQYGGVAEPEEWAGELNAETLVRLRTGFFDIIEVPKPLVVGGLTWYQTAFEQPMYEDEESTRGWVAAVECPGHFVTTLASSAPEAWDDYAQVFDSMLQSVTCLARTTPADSPETAAMEWVEAVLNLSGTTLAARTCAARQQDLQSGATLVSGLSALVGQTVEGDISDLRFEILTSSDNVAQVRVSGEVRVAVLGIADTTRVDETWEMVREGGKWKWCGRAEPPRAETPPGWRLYITEWRLGEDVLLPTQPKSGWQFATVDLVFENISGQWAMLPTADYSSGGPSLSGNLIDSGGYERSLSQLLAGSLDDYCERAVHLPAGGQIRGAAWSELPQNQEPSVLRLQADYDGDGTSDEEWEVTWPPLKETPPPLFESLRSFIPIADPGYVFDFPNDRRVTVTSAYHYAVEQPLRPGAVDITIRVGLTVENTGGYDLTVGGSRFQLLALDDQRRYLAACSTRGYSLTVDKGNLAPSQATNGYLTMTVPGVGVAGEPPGELLLLLQVFVKSGSQSAFFLPAKHDLMADQQAITALIRRHRQALIDAMMSSDATMLEGVYVDRSLKEIEEDSLLETVTCSSHDATVDFWETVSMELRHWSFPSESSAAVQAQEAVKEWFVRCPSIRDWQPNYHHESTYKVYYNLEKSDGVWRIASWDWGLP